MESSPLLITKDTKISDLLNTYGDIAEVMQAFGIKSAGGLAMRKMLGRFLTIESAARFHGVPLESFLPMVQEAVGQKVMP